MSLVMQENLQNVIPVLFPRQSKVFYAQCTLDILVPGHNDDVLGGITARVIRSFIRCVPAQPVGNW